MGTASNLFGITYEKLESGIWSPEGIPGLVSLGLAPKKRAASIGKTRGAKEPDLFYSQEKGIGQDFSAGFDEKALPSAQPMNITPDSTYSKPDAIKKLEEVLSAEYDSRVEVTSINELPRTRKEVKEVYFLINNSLTKVWVFKADPIRTKRELDIYDIAHKHDIPTGWPIGYKSEDSEGKYPFDVAIIGGEIIEHAGEPYNLLLNNLREKPNIIYKTAINIAMMIADYQIKLTLASEDLKKRGVSLENINPRKEITERVDRSFFPENYNPERLISSFEKIFKSLSAVKVISHGDIHTANIVTYTYNDPNLSKMATKIDRFGVIDWDSLGMENPLNDALDFWVHHKRTATKVCNIYDFYVDDFVELFSKMFNIQGKKHGLYLHHAQSIKDSCIESASWNLYEMFDRTRKDPADIEEKAKAHLTALLLDLKKLESFNLHDEVYNVRKELKSAFYHLPYLKPIFNKGI